jgi:hypothetical protein
MQNPLALAGRLLGSTLGEMSPPTFEEKAADFSFFVGAHGVSC